MSAGRQTWTVRRRALATALLMVTTLLGLSSANGAPGALDPTFDSDGRVTTDFGGFFDSASGVAVQTDGKIVVAGSGAKPQGSGQDDFIVARYNTDGTLDTSFDGDGSATTDFGSFDAASGLALQPDGKIVVVGTVSPSTVPDLALARYNSDGSLDTTFDGDGKVTIDLTAISTSGSDVIVQPDGKLVVAATSGFVDFAVARFNPNGSLDVTFDTDGKASTDFGEVEHAAGIALQPDGKIVLSGRTNGGINNSTSSNVNFAVARYNADGSLDTTFDADGTLTTDFGGFEDGGQVVIQSNDKIVVAGVSRIGGFSAPGDFAIARYDADGSLDPTFDGDGKVTTDFGTGTYDGGRGVVLQPDGKVVMAGGSRTDNSTSSEFAVARYNTDGGLDPSFGTNGKVTTDFGEATDAGSSSIVLQPDGGIVVAGAITPSSGGGSDFALARYLAATTVPDPPTTVTAVAGDASATVSWTAPTSDGGSPVTGYTVTASPGGATTSVGAATTTAVVNGLTNGTIYNFTVVATNAVGSSAASAPSSGITPAATTTTTSSTTTTTPATTTTTTTSTTTTVTNGTTGPGLVGEQGYALVGADGGVFNFGTARFFGSTGAIRLNRPMVAMDHTPSTHGYWLVGSDGGVFAFGDARFFGSTGAIRLNSPIVGIERTPTGRGYWLVAADGGVFAFGDARFLGSTGATRLNSPIVGIEGTSSGDGYWLVAADGGIFAFGDARFLGSTGATRPNSPIVGMGRTNSNGGYHLVAADGGIFAFGDAVFRGSMGATRLNSPIVAMSPIASGGYWLCAADGGVFAFGNAQFRGSMGAARLNSLIVGCDSPRRAAVSV